MKQALQVLKVFGIFAGSVATLFTVFVYLDSIKDDVEDIKETVDYISIEQGMMSGDIQKNTDTLQDIIAHQDKQDEQMDDMERAAAFYIRNQKALNEASMQDALEAILKKNKPTVYELSPYRDTMIQFQREMEWISDWNDWIEYALSTGETSFSNQSIKKP